MKFASVWNEIMQKIPEKRFPYDRLIFLESKLLDLDVDILNQDFEIDFIISEDEYSEKLKHKILESTNWRPTGKKDYWMRTDPPRAENQWNREICIAHKKNIRTNPQWTWKADLSRKDQHKFTKEPNSIVKQIAADFFGLNVNLIEVVLVRFDIRTTKVLNESYLSE
jgi:hypothetical protein